MNGNLSATIASEIKRLRLERGFTSAKELAAACHISSAIVSEFEAGRRKIPSLDHLFRIAEVLKVPLGELVRDRRHVFIPESLDMVASAQGLSYRDDKSLLSAWPQLSHLMSTEPEALQVLLRHPDLLKSLASENNRTLVLVQGQ